MDNDYYTYAYLREDRTPYYIGKGRGKRIHSKQRRIKAPKDKSLILFLKEGLTEAEAFKHEIYMIAILGRKDLGTGILRNLTDGGEGTSGCIRPPCTEETKEKLSDALSGENNPCYGRTGEKHPLFGVPNTKEQKRKISEALSGRTGALCPMYGRTGALSNCGKGIIAIKPDGTQLYFGSGREAARELEIEQGNLCGRYLKTGKSPKKGKFKDWQFLYENPSGVL